MTCTGGPVSIRLGVIRVLALASVLATMSCGTDFFACSDDDDCASGSTPGMCAAGGACAFPDDDCESGHRYGDHSGSMSGECVPPFDTTSGSDDAGTSGGPTTLDASMASDTLEDSATSPDATTLPLDTSTTDVDTTSPVSMGADSSSGDGTTGEPNDDPDLLVWLRFEALTDEGVPNDGVLGGHATCSSACPEVFAGRASFDGTSCLAFPHDDQLGSTTWTAATWVLANQATTAYNMMSKAYGDESDNSWELFTELSQMVGYRTWVEVAPGGSVDGPPPEIGVWMHVAATYDGGTLALYTNGEMAGAISVDVVVFDDHDVRFGCDSDNGADAYFHDGMLADMRIYKRALDETEIDALVAEPPPDP